MGGEDAEEKIMTAIAADQPVLANGTHWCGDIGPGRLVVPPSDVLRDEG
ncbi:MAG: hypothetical protein ACI92N_002797 [Pseudomonadales bacterium]|jgi:hypothetical protein|nr:hypothetical protein [Marinobacter maritimus]